jgi:prenyltransferase beta subunit
MSFGYRESPDSRLRDYLVVVRPEKNKQFGKNFEHPLKRMYDKMYCIYALSIFNNHGFHPVDSEFTTTIPALATQIWLKALIWDNLSCTP